VRDWVKRAATVLDLGRGGYLSQMGWFRTVREGRSVDANGEPLPWMTYAAIAFLEPRLARDMTVFEYGSGGSTLWWARRVARIFSVEHDAQFFETLKAQLPANATLFHVPLDESGAYAEKVSAVGTGLDVIVIDGRDRVRCAAKALTALAPSGVIVWDNSDRTEYQPGYQLLSDRGFRRLDFSSMGPLNAYGWCTSIFYRSDNRLGI